MVLTVKYPTFYCIQTIFLEFLTRPENLILMMPWKIIKILLTWKLCDLRFFECISFKYCIILKMSDVCKWENNAALPLGGRGVVHGPVKKHM